MKTFSKLNKITWINKPIYLIFIKLLLKIILFNLIQTGPNSKFQWTRTGIIWFDYLKLIELDLTEPLGLFYFPKLGQNHGYFFFFSSKKWVFYFLLRFIKNNTRFVNIVFN